ncbi:hypothetical protein [Frankia sp. AiPa1]|uniref:hypothetical protein n=1 Tax=Frankia sp. AiPa1 TaxID=573492 RepID=UPI00202AD351|nr:hypothetical protein [Frankia sp. AiPa1]MCL9758652.1 hypothetical protein [Frankia sp. AiPa1]
MSDPSPPPQYDFVQPGGRLFLTLKSGDPQFPGYPDELRRRAEDVLASDNLVEVVLYAHLLVEQALEILIKERFERSNVFGQSRFTRLTFAHKITVYVGLYGPDDNQIDRLQKLNRLRNRMAHSLADLEEAILHELPVDLGETALKRAKWAFLQIAFDDLGVIQGVSWAKFKARI